MKYSPDKDGIIRIFGMANINQAKADPDLLEVGGNMDLERGDFRLKNPQLSFSSKPEAVKEEISKPAKKRGKSND